MSTDCSRHIFTLKVHSPAPPELSLIAGDVLTNARAALDYLVYAAAEQRGVVTDANAHRYDFPIVDTEPLFRRRTSVINETLGEQFVEILRSVQRFALGAGLGRDERPLYLYTLRDLSNIDKHRELSIFGFGLLRKQLILPEGVTARDEAPDTWPLNDGDCLADLVLTAAAPRSSVELLVEWAPQLETRSTTDFWVGGRASGVLKSVLDFIVKSVLPRFDGVIPE